MAAGLGGGATLALRGRVDAAETTAAELRGAVAEKTAAQERASRDLEAARDREGVLAYEAASAALRAQEAEARVEALVGVAVARAALAAAVGVDCR